MICGTCGTDKERTNGYCINGHDDWIEWEDLLTPYTHKLITDSLKKLNITISELVYKIYISTNYLQYRKHYVIKTIFLRNFYNG